MAIMLYSSQVQQPMRATAVLGERPHTRWAAPVDREQGRAAGLHPEGHLGSRADCWLAAVESEIQLVIGIAFQNSG